MVKEPHVVRIDRNEVLQTVEILNRTAFSIHQRMAAILHKMSYGESLSLDDIAFVADLSRMFSPAIVHKGTVRVEFNL